jgi:hypothetical protein
MQAPVFVITMVPHPANTSASGPNVIPKTLMRSGIFIAA